MSDADDLEIEEDPVTSAVTLLQDYITQNEGAIRLAGPPTLQGSLANFYSQNVSVSTLI